MTREREQARAHRSKSRCRRLGRAEDTEGDCMHNPFHTVCVPFSSGPLKVLLVSYRVFLP